MLVDLSNRLKGAYGVRYAKRSARPFDPAAQTHA